MKYRICSKQVLVNNLDSEEAYMVISQLEMNNNEQGLKYELEEYNPEKPKSSKGGRDPDLYDGIS